MALIGVRRALIRPKRVVAAGGVSFSLAYQPSSLTISTDSTHLTVDYGTISYAAGATRTIVAIGYLASTTTQTVSSVTIGGVPLAPVSGCYVQNGGAFGQAIDMWISTGPLSGSSGDVQVTYSAAVQGGGQSAVAIYNLTTATPAVNASTNGVTSFNNVLTNTLNIPAGGGALTIIAVQNGHTITSITNGTIDDQNGSGAPNTGIGHSTATGASTVLTANISSSDGIVMCSASWAP